MEENQQNQNQQNQEQSQEQESQQPSGQKQQPQSIQKEEKNIMAVLSYLGIPVLVPLLAVKDDEFIKFHAKQGLVLFIAEVATTMVAWIPIIGWIGSPILYMIWLVLAIIGIVNVLQGQKKELPLIGKFAEKFNI